MSELIHEDHRPLLALFDESVPRTSERIRMCSWCKRVCLESDRWVEPEAAIERMGLFEEM